MAQMHRDDKGIRRNINMIRMDELAYSAIIKELERGNGRVALAWLEGRGHVKPDTSQSDTLRSSIVALLPPTLTPSTPSTNANAAETIQAAAQPPTDGDDKQRRPNFSELGLTPVLEGSPQPVAASPAPPVFERWGQRRNREARERKAAAAREQS